MFTPSHVVKRLSLGIFWIAASTVQASVINVPADHATIQAAIVAAGAGDEIIVAPGTYVEAIDFLGKAITVRSSGGAGVTTIDGSGASRVVECVSGETAATVFEGFTVTNGLASGSFPSNAGGGMFISGCDLTVRDCVFTANSANFGGAMAVAAGSEPTITGCTFHSNLGASVNGIYCFDSDPSISDCVFRNNRGALAFFKATAATTVDNCVFTGNNGFAIGVASSSSPTLTNNTFSGNTDNTFGGAIFVQGGSSPTVTNCILWGNSPDEIKIAVAGVDSLTVSFSDVEGGLPAGTIDGGNNIDVDPLFVDSDGADNVVGTEDDNLRLLLGSPCQDAGDDAAPGLVGVTTDLDGNPRFVCCAVDMGAYETQQCVLPIIPVPYALLGIGPDGYAPRNRYLSFIPPELPINATEMAFRVTFTKMPGPGDCPLVDDYSAFENQVMWVGPETAPAGPGASGVYRLQPDALFQDWGSVVQTYCVGANGTDIGETVPCDSPAVETTCNNNGGTCEPLVIVSDCNIIPCAEYTIEAVTDDCPLEESSFSDLVVLPTTDIGAACPAVTPRWADIVGAYVPGMNRYEPADGCVDFNDIAALIERFKNLTKAPPRSWCDVVGGPSPISDETMWQGATFNVDFLDISTLVKAFGGEDYPLAGPTAPNACP